MKYQPGKFLRLYYEGLGNIYYDLPPSGAANVLDAANDGLSTDAATAKIAQLGQTVGRLGNPAVLLENREIPFDIFSLLLNNIGKAAGGHLIFKKDAGADGLIEPFIEVLNSAGATLLKIRVTDNNSLFLTRVLSAATGRNNVVIGNDAGAGLTSGRDDVLIGAGSGFSLTTQQGWVVIGEDNVDQFPGSTAGDFGIVIGANNFNAGFITNIGNNCKIIGNLNNNSIGNSIGDFVIVIGDNMGLGGNMHDTIIIGSQVTTGPTITISNVVILGTGAQNILMGQSPVGAVYQDTGERVQVRGTVKARNVSLGIRAGIAADTFTANDCTLLMDSTAGNMTVSLTPANLSTIGAAGVNQQRGGIIGNIKKISADLNTITLNATSGLIYGLGAPAASLAFNTQGQSVTFQSDGTNIYIL